MPHITNREAKGLGSVRRALAVPVLAAIAACEAGSEGELRALAPEVVVLEGSPALGPNERPVVELRHDLHTRALGPGSCGSCHVVEGGVVSHEIAATRGAAGRDAVMRAFHGLCIGCHEEPPAEASGSGPLGCGECHARRPRGVPRRAPLRFDLDLHQRHVLAEGGRCDGCHHVLDAARGQLVHREGAEGACRDCHGAGDTETARSLRRASHDSCITCHRDRAAEGRQGGPVTCAGCHDPAAQAGFGRLAEVPRLEWRQPDLARIHTEGATTRSVPFDHRAHETVADRCSFCHHATIRPCGECHTLAGADQGGGVTLEEAFHRVSSERSCVGCHDRLVMEDGNCAGCHGLLGRPPSAWSCSACHAGPEPDRPAEASPEAALELAAAPEPSRDLPDEVEIGVLARRYGAARMPHRDILAAYDAVVRSSALALRFHGRSSTFCSACHHHSPEGERPPACASCHPDRLLRTDDRPGLRAAYHRQCIGCHARAGLPTGCTSCHPEETDRPER